MAFEFLINKPAHESDILKQLTFELQTNNDTYQSQCFFIKLSKLESGLSEIVWVKLFENESALMDFFYDSEFERACVLIKFEKGAYKILCSGFHLSDFFKIYPDRTVTFTKPSVITWDVEKDRMVPREILEGAFAEISETLKSSGKAG